MLSRRLVHTSSRRLNKFKLDPNYKFKCGIEIHTQLKTRYKLFSLSPSSFYSSPNSKISYFDVGLPGTQPKLNPEALYLALKLAVALNSDVQLNSTFDRKHYFYPDQPLGYQITQHYHPIAKNGFVELKSEFDEISVPSKIINIEQIQIEQDTGKTSYDKYDKTIKVDYNRSNVPLIELVTKPDFEDLKQVGAFVKNYQTLVKHLDICTGNLETGAIRVDVNVSVNGHPRVEIKNLGSNGEIQEALKYEYNRQVQLLKNQEDIIQETRGWTGNKTVTLRIKEDAVDYRYVPDSELPFINLSSTISSDIRKSLPELPEQILKKLTSEPYSLELKYAKFLVDNKDILTYYYHLIQKVNEKQQPTKLANNWLFHEYLGAFTKLNIEVDMTILAASLLGDLIVKVGEKEISTTSARLLLLQLLQTPEDRDKSIDELIEQYDLGKPQDLSADELHDAVRDICSEIVDNNPDVVERIKKGQKNSIKFLVGLGMRETQGKVDAKAFTEMFKELLKL
ncbi:amidotransferase subunit B, mitochondrial [Scheffersomyces xylosifermentans]|uniref:amidotransferase subunit B, mitochondrial n=1 Tax=Scheffersomyces xylosifermentans TaxID=1304137 RepID=UPI00315D1697